MGSSEGYLLKIYTKSAPKTEIRRGQRKMLLAKRTARSFRFRRAITLLLSPCDSSVNYPHRTFNEKNRKEQPAQFATILSLDDSPCSIGQLLDKALLLQ